MKIRALLLLTALTIATPPALALEEPRPSPDDTRVRLVNYNELDVVRVIGTMRTSVQIVFAQGEEIIDVAIGDTIAWEPRPRGNILFLKAREPHPPSNLQVVTVRADGTTRSYNFELITREGDIMNNQEDVYFAIRFRYPNDEANARRAQIAADRAAAQQRAVEVQLRNAAVNAGPRNWMYTYAGPRSLRPTEVFDNGTTTVISFGNSSRMPSVYLADENGNERLANTTISNNRIIVQGVAEQITLRRGGQVAGIFNENFGGPGHFSETGTVSHRVDREIIGGQ
ncbi:P-type conjugative transfer protein VirB9 [Parasulfitobacter algicola]|uniref:P-type conjugative transfer protein VirB9 n=1 Tax=Parasulfitobacter algicola TaxID=2614809 RepID=A0ABX2J0W3_9RHOB|nr:P-type conjugative transfer protein VirB9 [Sulfitobacter algicola]NSX56799.1 P-type conjugative transfer protein VirB9 [Sulfitobacter algicola]